MADIKRLAEIFSPYATLYAVGGCVRDKLRGEACDDVDVCAKLTVDDVKKVLLNTEFGVSVKSLRMGTVHIFSKGFDVEYTTFRTDSYAEGTGEHSPVSVKFTDDIRLDALRRDFKCNAVYWDILNDKIVDPLGGVKDIENKILSAADEPDNVFGADGLRILRLVRFASVLGFDIEKETFQSAKRNAWRVKDIAVERVRVELEKIFFSKHHLKGFRLLDELGLVDMLLPELCELKGLEQPKQWHMYDAYEHSIKAYEIAPPHLRWPMLLHDIGKRRAYDANGGKNMHGHDEIGAKMANELLLRLRFSNDERKRIVTLVRLHMYDINGNTSPSKMRRFVVKNHEYIDDLCEVMDLDSIASNGEPLAVNRVREFKEQVDSDGTPLCVRELKVNGNDLLELGVNEKEIGGILEGLFEETILNPHLHNRERAMKYIEKKLGK